MKVEVNTSYLFDHFLREDLKESLGYDGFKTLVDYYEESENAPDYDIALFWCWSKGTPEDVLREREGDEAADKLRREYTDEDGDIDEDEFTDACRLELESLGEVVQVYNDNYIPAPTGEVLFRRWGE